MKRVQMPLQLRHALRLLAQIKKTFQTFSLFNVYFPMKKKTPKNALFGHQIV